MCKSDGSWETAHGPLRKQSGFLFLRWRFKWIKENLVIINMTFTIPYVSIMVVGTVVSGLNLCMQEDSLGKTEQKLPDVIKMVDFLV